MLSLAVTPLASDAVILYRTGDPAANTIAPGGQSTLTYSKVTTATDLQYSVEESTDLATWSDANPTNQIVATQGNVETIKALVAINGASRLFLRLRITRP